MFDHTGDERTFDVAGGFPKEAEVEIAVEGVVRREGAPTSGERLQRCLICLALEELKSRTHHGTPIDPDAEQPLACSLKAFLARNAEKVPDRLLRVVRVDSNVRLELLRAIPEAISVVEGEPTLP